jgi:hypothetical protein
MTSFYCMHQSSHMNHHTLAKFLPHTRRKQRPCSAFQPQPSMHVSQHTAPLFVNRWRQLELSYHKYIFPPIVTTLIDIYALVHHPHSHNLLSFHLIEIHISHSCSMSPSLRSFIHLLSPLQSGGKIRVACTCASLPKQSGAISTFAPSFHLHSSNSSGSSSRCTSPRIQAVICSYWPHHLSHHATVSSSHSPQHHIQHHIRHLIACMLLALTLSNFGACAAGLSCC